MRKIYRKILICSILVAVILIVNATVGYINNILPNDLETETQKWYHNSITGRYAEIFILFPYLPVIFLFAILYDNILIFYT